MGFDGAQGPPTTEALYRIQGLKDCAARVEANTQSGILQKPGSGVGILTKVTPRPGGAEYATAKAPATVYEEPGGPACKDDNGDDIGIPQDSKWLVLEKRKDPVWYLLQTPPLTKVPCWVWGDDVTIGL
jgi:hypothetical protein